MDNLLTLTDEEFWELFKNVIEERNRREAEKRDRCGKRLRELLDEAQKIMDECNFSVRACIDYDGYIESFEEIEY